MDDLLKAWGLETLIAVFAEHKIDEESFALLNETYIEQLVPAIGLQLKLKRRLQEYLEKDSIDTSTDIASASNSIVATSCENSITNETDIIVVDRKLVEEQSSSRASTASASTSTIANFLHNFEESTAYDLNGLLNGSNEGTQILKHYQIHSELKRKLLVNLIINRELRDNPDKRISGERFLLIAESICKVFPVESPRTYFIPGYRDCKGKNISAHGQLWNKYINTRTIYRNLNIIPKAKNRNSSSNIETKELDELQPADIILENIHWLQKNIHPWPKVEEYWKLTCTTRLKTYMNEKPEIHAYFKLYPCLAEPQGYSLLLLDFEHIYPNKVNLLFTEWPLIYKNLINLARRKKCPILEGIIKKYLDQESSEHEDRKYIEENVAFIIFPLLFPNIIRRSRQKTSKYSRIEMQNSFIKYIEADEDLNGHLEQSELNYRTTKRSEQPTVYVCGNLANPKNILKINDVMYDGIESLTKCVDLCFKTYFVLNAKYPIESEQCWMYLQQEIYGIKTKEDTTFSSVTTLKSDILLNQQHDK